jgi:hypothetical protein
MTAPRIIAPEAPGYGYLVGLYEGKIAAAAQSAQVFLPICRWRAMYDDTDRRTRLSH